MGDLDVHDRPLLLRRRDAAKVLAISERKLWQLTASGQIRHVRIGRSVRYETAALRGFLAAHEGGITRTDTRSRVVTSTEAADVR